jgi:hypothetical protein
MPQSIANFSPVAVIEAIEANLIDSSIALGRTEDGVVFRGSDVTWVYTGYRALGRVMRARFNSEEAEDRVAEIAECFRQWDAPVMWVIGPTSFPPELGDYLRESGFQTNEQWMGMAVDLKTIPDGLAQSGSLRIERISEKAQLEEWTNLSSENWTSESWTGEAGLGALNIFSPENAGSDPRCRYYLGYLNDEPVVRGMACVNGDTAGLYWINAKPKYRDAGYDIALAARALFDARASGTHLGVMPVKTETSPLCKTLGLKQYCQFHIYIWPAPLPKIPVC